MTTLDDIPGNPPPAETEDESDVYRDDRTWAIDTIAAIRDELRPERTKLTRIPLPDAFEQNGLTLHVKREAEQPSGSHKHRLAAALLTHAVSSGWLSRNQPVVEASSGSTAISEAWYCQKLKIPFYAVVPAGTAKEKLQAIRDLDGAVIPTTGDIVQHARRVAARYDGHFMDQFTYAERAYDWRGTEGLAQELLDDLKDLKWFVMGAGTGGTATSVARHARYSGSRLRVCVPDPDHSAFFDGWYWRDPTVTDQGSLIEGIGRPRVEASFVPATVNRMIRAHDAASVATMRVLAKGDWNIQAGPSTGTGVFGAIRVLLGMLKAGESGGVATVMCDPASRYTNEYYDDAWLKEKKIDYKPWVPTIETFFETGEWAPPAAFQPVPRPAAALWNM
ncbi:PLP-dependent cysteine synthase family protein [Kitasatospora sp. NPDC089509]|uniref:PLP-dependent cysteine synthase family protein n=1 Tax=Kitasatospora sp. NPDC089509 TaxID=3364079 RepID=UPI00381898E2